MAVRVSSSVYTDIVHITILSMEKNPCWANRQIQGYVDCMPYSSQLSLVLVRPGLGSVCLTRCHVAGLDTALAECCPLVGN